jgi:cytochrome c biogenesis protein CcdA
MSGELMYRARVAILYGVLLSLILALSAYTSLFLGLDPKTWIPLALADSINPCEIVIQVTIGVSVAIASTVTNGFVTAIIYAFGVVTSYYLLGLGLSFIAVYIPTWLAGSVAIVYGGYVLLKSLLVEEESCPSCVERGKSKLHYLNLGYIGAYALGFLIGLTISPCTIGPYPIFLTLIKELSMMNKLIAMLSYNLIFGAPLFLVSFAISVAELSQKTQLAIIRNYRKIRIASGILMMGIGIYILYLYHP